MPQSTRWSCEQPAYGYIDSEKDANRYRNVNGSHEVVCFVLRNLLHARSSGIGRCSKACAADERTYAASENETDQELPLNNPNLQLNNSLAKQNCPDSPPSARCTAVGNTATHSNNMLHWVCDEKKLRKGINALVNKCQIKMYKS